MSEERILVVDDEKAINKLICSYLQKEHFEAVPAFNGSDALALTERMNPSLIILDIMLPDVEGITLAPEIRKITDCPILFLSAKTSEIDKIKALSAGGDDYITKPFMPGELLARVKAHLRRQKSYETAMEKKAETLHIVEFQNAKIDFDTYECSVDGKGVSLTSKEYDILRLLMENPRKVFPAEQIYESVWKTNCLENDARTVMVYISTLRKKLEDSNGGPSCIVSVRGVGYKFNQSLLEK